MANYTDSPMDLFQRNFPEGGSWEDEGTILDLSKSLLMPKGALSHLDPEFQDPFALGFALHYLIDEIALDTWPLWRLRLRDRIVNNAAYINEVYKLSVDPIFTHRHRRKASGESVSHSVTGVTGTTDGTTATVTGGSTVTDRTTQQTQNTISANTVTSTTDNTSNTNTKQEGTTDGTEDTTATGDSTTSDTRDRENHFSDTPQNGLTPVRLGEYLTNATVEINTDNQTVNKSDTNNRVTRQTDTQDTDSDQTEHGVTIQDSKGTQEVTNNGAEHQAITNDGSSNGTTHNDSRTDSDTQSVTSRDDNDQDDDLDYMSFLQASPALSKLWPLFDDIFLSIL